MTTPLFSQSLNIVLEQLQKPHWHSPLQKLASHFDQVPEILDVSFENELLNALWSLVDAAKADPHAPIELMAAIRLSKLLGFTLRASHVASGFHLFWNPLEESYSQFANSATKVAQAADAFPPEDIIKRWVRDNLL